MHRGTIVRPPRRVPPAAVRRRGEGLGSSAAARLRSAACGALAASVTACATPAPPPLPDDFPAVREWVIESDEGFVRTGYRVEAGDVLELRATGDVCVVDGPGLVWSERVRSGPGGTYSYPEELLSESYPLAAGSAGPTPAFALLARVGEDGAPFLVGEHRVVRMPRAGELEFGPNDFDPRDNEGSYRVGVRPVGDAALAGARPADARPVVTGVGEPDPADRPDRPHVLLLFVDGLRPDVLREMAFHGDLPNFRRIFFDGGADIERTVTISPSNTLPASVACLTGCWPDRTGFFTQLPFHRESGDLEYLLDATGPVDAARRIERPWWVEAFARDDGPRPRLAPTILEEHGRTFSSTMLPVVGDFPPDFWFQRMANEMDLLGAHRLHEILTDRVQTAHAVEEVIDADHDLMMVWYPAVDSLGHRTPRGLFGASRVALAQLDTDLPRLEAALADEEILDSTYFVLFADHGTTGGEQSVHRVHDLADHFCFRSLRDDDADGVLDAGAGLGMNVRYLEHDVPVLRRHPDLSKEDFAVCASQAYASSWLALPRGRFDSRDWSAPNGYAELSRYAIHPDLEPVDVPRRLLACRSGADGSATAGESVVEFVAVPDPPDRLLLLGQRGDAVIERRVLGDDPRAFEYRYRVVEAIRPDADGRPVLRDAAPSVGDPLGYRERIDGAFLSAWHDDRSWLAATVDEEFPDAVCALSHHLLADPRHPDRAERQRYDVFVVAARGFSLGPASRPPSVDHGAPYREAARIPFLVAGPGVTPGVRIETPARIVDVLPTVLELLDVPYHPGRFDGRAVRGIWAEPIVNGAGEPVARALGESVPVALPALRREDGDEPVEAVHDPDSWYDGHSLATNFAALLSQELLRLVDRALDTFVVPGKERRPVGSSLDFAGTQYERLPEGRLRDRPAELFEALRLRQITVGEFISPPRSLQHLDRVTGVLRWVDAVVRDPFEPWVARDSLVYAPIHYPLEGAAWTIDEVKDLLTELFVRVGDGVVVGAESAGRFVAGWFAEDEPPRFQRPR